MVDSTTVAAGFFDEFYYGLVNGMQVDPASPSPCMKVLPKMGQAWANFTTEIF
jgi:hypothetical protein